MPLLRFGVAFVLPAPPTLIEPAEAWLLCTLPIFCIKELSPLGAEAVNVPAVVDINNVSPALKLDVSKPPNVPNVTTVTDALLLASALARPKLGILFESSASALDTTGVFPEMPDM